MDDLLARATAEDAAAAVEAERRYLAQLLRSAVVWLAPTLRVVAPGTPTRRHAERGDE